MKQREKALKSDTEKIKNEIKEPWQMQENLKYHYLMKSFQEEQQKYAPASTKSSILSHPMIIQYCLALSAKSSAVYDRSDMIKNS